LWYSSARSFIVSSVPFITGGFGNWRKALKRFQEHKKSEIHIEAVKMLAAKASTVQYIAKQQFHKTMLIKLLGI